MKSKMGYNTTQKGGEVRFGGMEYRYRVGEWGVFVLGEGADRVLSQGTRIIPYSVKRE